MTHRYIQKQLSAYLDGELNDQVREKVDLHLLTCDECKQIISEFRQNRLGLASLRQPAPPGIWEVVQERILNEQPRNRRERSSPQLSLKRPAFVGVTVFVAACLILGILHFYPTQKPTEAQIESPLELYLIAHTGHVPQLSPAENPKVSEVLVANKDISSESELTEETQVFLDFHMSSLW